MNYVESWTYKHVYISMRGTGTVLSRYRGISSDVWFNIAKRNEEWNNEDLYSLSLIVLDGSYYPRADVGG